tara:strand:+ start:406 stop:624 length:219 start_codon:yes stop_codon:yes gene_type:complete
MHDALTHPVEPIDPFPDDIDLLLDHYIIVRKDGTAVLNGKPEEFEKVLRELIVNRQQAYAYWYHNRLKGDAP